MSKMNQIQELIYSQKKTKNLNIRINEVTLYWLKKEAKEQGLSLSKLIQYLTCRECVRTGLGE